MSTNSAFLLSAETRLRLCVANESRIRVAPSSRTQTRMKRIHVHESDEPEFVGWALERPSSQTADELFQSEVRYLKNRAAQFIIVCLNKKDHSLYFPDIHIKMAFLQVTFAFV